jgi:hypothetical protein
MLHYMPFWCPKSIFADKKPFSSGFPCFLEAPCHCWFGILKCGKAGFQNPKATSQPHGYNGNWVVQAEIRNQQMETEIIFYL